MIMDGFWEYWLTKYFAEQIKPGDTVIDIGANLGYYTLLAGDLVTATGRVVAVEPNPLVFELLSKSVKKAKRASTAVLRLRNSSSQLIAHRIATRNSQLTT